MQITWKKVLRSVIAVLTAFLGFWGICLLATIIAGGRPEDAFPHKLLCLLFICIFQIGIATSDPTREGFPFWLRLCTVAAGMLFSCELFLTELIALKLVDPSSLRPWTIFNVLLVFGMATAIGSMWKKRMAHNSSENLK